MQKNPYQFCCILFFFIFYQFEIFGFDKCKHIPNKEAQIHIEKVYNTIRWNDSTSKVIEQVNLVIDTTTNANDVFHLRIKTGLYIAKNNSIQFYDYAKKYFLTSEHEICIHFEEVLGLYINQVLQYENRIDLTNLIRVLEKNYDDFSEVIVQKYLANVYFKQGDYEMAIVHWKLSIDKYSSELNSTKKRVSSLYNNIGVAYKRLGKLDESKKAILKAMNIWNSLKHKEFIDQNYQKYFSMVMEDNLMKLEKSTPNLIKKRFNHYEKMYRFGKEKTLPVFGFQLHSIITNLAFDCGEYEKGYYYYYKTDSLINSHPTSDLNTLFSFYSLKIKYHSIKGEHQDVFNSLIKLDSIKSEKYKWYKEILPEIDALDSKYTNNLLIKKQEAFKLERKTRFLLYSTIFVLITLILYTLYINRKERKAREQINIQKNIIEFSLEKTKILIKELHHRVKNNLQFVNSIVYLEYIKNKNKFDVNSFERKIISLAQVHDMLYSSENISHVSIKDYVQKLVSEINSASNNQFNYTLNISSEIKLSLDTTISFGLIINELITNTLKYCQPKSNQLKSIHINIYKLNDHFVLEYKDNGLKREQEKEVSSISNFSLITLLVERLKGSLKMINLLGYHVMIQFKDSE